MARLALLVHCDACGQVFDTGIRIDRRNFARATLATNYHTCPVCGKRGTYHKDQYIVQEDAPAHDRSPGREEKHSADGEGAGG